MVIHIGKFISYENEQLIANQWSKNSARLSQHIWLGEIFYKWKILPKERS